MYEFFVFNIYCIGKEIKRCYLNMFFSVEMDEGWFYINELIILREEGRNIIYLYFVLIKF